jgi:hypothetical protein
MGFSAALAQLSSYINHQSANLNDQINRLEKAKREIKKEQNGAFDEWNTNLVPYLDTYWEGNRASSFYDSRKSGYEEMLNIFRFKYDEYLQKIDSELRVLEIDRSALSISRSLTIDAERLLKKGEEAAEELQGKIKQIRRHLS